MKISKKNFGTVRNKLYTTVNCRNRKHDLHSFPGPRRITLYKLNEWRKKNVVESKIAQINMRSLSPLEI